MPKLYKLITIISCIYLCGILSCKTGSKVKNHISYRYYKDFDFIHLEFIDPVPSKPPLPYIKVDLRDGSFVQASVYKETEKKAIRIFKPITLEGYKSFSSESFDGKFLSYDTLISSENTLYEFRYRYYDKKVNEYSILIYSYYSVDSFEVFWNNFSNTMYKIVAPPKIYPDVTVLQNFKPTDTGSFHFFRSNIFLMEFYETSRDERITDPRGKARRRWDFQISSFWTLFKHPLWYVLPNVNGLGAKRD